MSDDNPVYEDNYVIYELDNNCDPAEIVEYENIIEQEEEEYEEIEQIEDVELKPYMVTSEIEYLGDDEIIEEQKAPEEIETDTKEFLDINEPIDNVVQSNVGKVDIKLEISEQAEEFIEHKTDALLTKKKPQRYLLFDDLVATIVDYDEEDGTPLVQFAVSSSPADENLPIECGICPDVMPKSKLSNHLKKHLVPGTNRYKCLYCEETYKDYKYLASHARRHMGIRPYVCETCKLYFSTKQDMRVHNQRRHQEKEHICEVCGKTFAQNTMLKRHRESTHEKKRRFKCDHCPKAYYKNFSLQEHIRSVHMGQRRMLKCPFCGMQCLDAHKMARHRKLWHLNQLHYKCEICDEKFTNVHYFDAHKRSIQCRENTLKHEERSKQLQAATTTDTSQPQEASTNMDDNSDIVWDLKSEQTDSNKMYTNNNGNINNTYMQLVLPNQHDIITEEAEEEEIDNIFEQEGNVLFEITLDGNENN